MVNPLTTEQYIEKAKNVHGDRYDYSELVYESARKNVTIICYIHGKFMQIARNHISVRPNGCPECGKQSSIEKHTKSLEQFILDARAIHGDRYQYDLVEYVNNQTNVKITCPTHGVFEQQPGNHLNKQGCPICSNHFSRTTEQFIGDSKKVHGNKYDYTPTEFINVRTNVKIICKIHGEFSQRASDHLDGSGCPECGKLLIGATNKSNVDEFIQAAKNVHGNKYDYSLVNYENCRTKVAIKCKKHGNFMQLPVVHLGGSGCPICKASKGEKAVRKFLEHHKMNYIYQKKFDNCKDAKQLPFDFYVETLNLLIEFDGKQHGEVVSIFGGEEGFADRLKKDGIKNKYAKNNGIGLVRIYNICEINEILMPWIKIYSYIEEHLELKPVKYIYYDNQLLIDDLEWQKP